MMFLPAAAIILILVLLITFLSSNHEYDPTIVNPLGTPVFNNDSPTKNIYSKTPALNDIVWVISTNEPQRMTVTSIARNMENLPTIVTAENSLFTAYLYYEPEYLSPSVAFALGLDNTGAWLLNYIDVKNYEINCATTKAVDTMFRFMQEETCLHDLSEGTRLVLWLSIICGCNLDEGLDYYTSWEKEYHAIEEEMQPGDIIAEEPMNDFAPLDPPPPFDPPPYQPVEHCCTNCRKQGE